MREERPRTEIFSKNGSNEKLFNFLVESARRAIHPAARFLALGICLLQFSTVLQGCTFSGANGTATAYRPAATPSLAAPSSTPVPALTRTLASPLPEATAVPTASVTATLGASATATRSTPTQSAGTSNTVSQSAAMLPEAQAGLAALRDLTHYDIQANLDFAAHTLQGHSQVVYTNTESVSLGSLFFRLLPNGGGSYGNGSLTVSSVMQDGRPLETALSVNDSALEVKLAEALEPGEQVQIDMDFAAAVPENFGQTGYGIYNYYQGVMSLADWYPILAVYDQSGWNLDPVSDIGDSVYADMAFYSVDLTTAKDLVVAATGVEAGRRPEGEKEEHLLASGPAREFFLVVSDRLQAVSETVGGTKINSYSLPDQAAPGKDALNIAVQAVKAYEKLFGLYPYVELDVVDVPLNYAAGVEYPGIVLIAESLYADERQPVFSVVVSHEVAHQWWYNLVGNDVFDDPWMDEALATYSSALYFEQVSGPRAYQANIDSFQKVYDDLLANSQDDLVTAGLPHYEQQRGKNYGAVVYRKGALFFHSLRKEIGDEAFFRALSAYFRSFEYRIARPEDLLDAFEQAAGRPLDDFYQKWLYSKK